ncbi:hypothetical protein LTR36_009138 [Oleoguttula mirabilis]|uniref:SET domain-containing protein n=1 Tax=Oleoguttula mirabilis TaxID=1507867 RepID=A0AAV9J7Y3_9PEZI|nr:hypothetical protein LTR36_009138 [Oleoguttula mirabilis]
MDRFASVIEQTRPRDRPASVRFDLRATPSKGYGFYALHAIERGTLIIDESPLVAVPPGINDASYLLGALKKLTQEQLTTFHNLHFDDNEASAGEDDKAISIFALNNVEMGSEQTHGRAVFAKYSRLNHSCLPNIDNSYSASTGKLTAHAIRHIESGEELTTSYINLVQPAEQRALELRQWGFECSCSVCGSRDVAASNKRRQRMCSIREAFDIMVDHDDETVDPDAVPITPSERSTWAAELAKLCKEEGLVGRDLEHA